MNNEEEMFVTVWFGILEISTGRVTAANAGHEYPIVRKADGGFELFKEKHGFVIGGMPGVKYTDYELTLEKGGTLFLYTDGVAEATNANNELFGTERMIAALNKEPQASSEVLLGNMKQAVDDYIDEDSRSENIISRSELVGELQRLISRCQSEGYPDWAAAYQNALLWLNNH
jgi:sigma-B regulation protein RsbU (phosphoserine phosphatase)